MKPIHILRVPIVMKRIGIGRATLYRWIKEDPTFPRPVKIGAKSVVGFIEAEVDQWLEARIRASRKGGA